MSNCSVPASTRCQGYTDEQSIILSGKYRKPTLEIFLKIPGKLKWVGELYFLTRKEKYFSNQSLPPITEWSEQLVLQVIYKDHRGNCNRVFKKYLSPKVLPVLFKMHTITFETRLSCANCKENKTVLLGLALSKALGVDCQNKNLLFWERWTAGTSGVLEKIIHLQSYLAGCQISEYFRAQKHWSHNVWFDQFSPPWPLLTSQGNLPCRVCL